jgi:hypothetical protein
MNQPLFDFCDETPSGYITYENNCYKVYDLNSNKTFYALTAEDAYFLHARLQALSPENIERAATNVDKAIKLIHEKHNKQYVNPGTRHTQTIIQLALNLPVTQDELICQQTYLPLPEETI